MVREYSKNDIGAIINFLNIHNELSKFEEEKKRKELENGGKVLVYEDNGEVKGICSLDFWENPELGNCAEIVMSVEEGPKFIKTANSLWQSTQAALKEKNVVFINTYYNEKQKQWREFYDEKQFGKWFGIRGMIYKGGKYNKTKLSIRNYEEDDFERYYTYLGQCFKPMREANDIRPFDVYKGSTLERLEKRKKEMLEDKDSIYLFYDGENLVGSTTIKHEEIDDVFVVPEYQGLGYGRKIMEATLNMALERNFDKITLGAVAWNKAAINLYKSLGFEVYQSFEHRRLFLKK